MPLTKKINLQTTDNKELNTGADWALAGNCFDESEIVKNISEGMAFIMDGAYKNCRSLTKVIVPFGITDICEEAFMNCGSLKEIWLPPTVKCIRSSAFSGCRSLAEVRGGEGLEVIESRAFFGCVSLTEFSFSSSLHAIANDAFSHSSVCIPSTYFDRYTKRAAHGGMTTIPDGIRTIGAYAFSGWKTLRVLTLPDSVRNISRCAFGRLAFSFDPFDDGIDKDCIDSFPEKMNMPEGYLRQQTQFDAQMALALCDTVWKDCTFVEDFAAIALYQNDRAARYLAAVKIREVEEFFVPGNTWRAVDFMLENYRVTAGDLLHFAEYIALNFPLLQSNPRHPYRKAGEIDAVVRRLYKEAVCCGAAEAMKLLQQYCFGAQQEDSFCELYYQQISPFEADYLLSLTSDACAAKDGYQGEAQLHRNGSEEYAPAEFFRVITALMYKSDILGWLRQYRSADRYKNDRAVETALKELDVNDLAEFGARNNSKWIFNVLCSCGDETLLTLLCRKTIEQAKSDEEQHDDSLAMLLCSLRLSKLSIAEKLSERLSEEIYFNDDGEADFDEFGEHYADEYEEYDEYDEYEDEGDDFDDFVGEKTEWEDVTDEGDDEFEIEWDLEKFLHGSK